MHTNLLGLFRVVRDWYAGAFSSKDNGRKALTAAERAGQQNQQQQYNNKTLRATKMLLKDLSSFNVLHGQ